MAEPSIAEPQGGEPEMAESTDEPVADVEEPPQVEDDPEIEEVELSESDYATEAAEELFSGTEGASEGQESDDSDDGDSDDSGGLQELGEAAAQMEQAINEGAAELATVQLPEDEDRDELRDEFQGVFEAFRLGHFGSKAVEEYVLVSEGDEVDPLYGLLGAMLACGAFVLWMRPDGDDAVQRAKDALANIAGGNL